MTYRPDPEKQKKLIKWYENNGFKLDPNASNFGRDEIFMVRYPR